MVTAAALGMGTALAEPIKPNIIYVITDDMGWGDAGFNGQQKIKTPVMDRLAAEGAVLNAYYAGAPVCGPSRATLMTGRHTGHCKVRGNPKWTQHGKPVGLDESDMTLPKELKRAGYANACYGKWGLNDALVRSGHPLMQGFDEFYGYNTHGEAHFHWPDYLWHNYEKVDLGGPSNWEEKKIYSNDLFTDEAEKFIEAHAGKQPFFLYLAYTIPHLGISVPEDSQVPYRELGWPVKKGNMGHYRNDPDMNVSYAGMISRVDGYMERIVQKLKEQKIDRNTLIIFSSDNGHEFDTGFFDSNGIYSGKKRAVHEGGIRMPAFAWWPGSIKPGGQVDHACAFWDVLPTLCELAGVTPSQATDGISFVPALTGGAQKSHPYLYWEFNEKTGPMQAIRFGNWKAMRHWDFKGEKLGPIKLYDLAKDPAEEKDLAAANPEVMERAETYLKTARTEHPEFPLALLPAAKAHMNKNKGKK